MERVSIKEIIRDLDLNVVYMPENKDYYVYSQDINRPGLQFAGYFEDFAYERIQIVGKTEYNYFSYIDDEKRREVLDKFFSHEIPVFIVSRNLEVRPDVIEFAKKYNRIILSTKRNTTRLINRLSNYLDSKLAPQTTIHGVLVDIYGIGVLIKGESSIGKSETALELIQRGHRLVADEAVEIRRTSKKTLVGTSPENIRHFIELRGIGIINARRIFGMGAIKQSEKIDMVINMEIWDPNKAYDRMGLDSEYTEIMGVKVPVTTIPVHPGRNLSMIIEVAAMNNRQKKMGYNAALELLENLGMSVGEEEVQSIKVETGLGE